MNHSFHSCFEWIKGGICAPQQFRANGMSAGIKESGASDLGVLISEVPCSSAGTFTQNRIRAACVDWCEHILPSSLIRACVCNSGNANACTGPAGTRHTRAIAADVAGLLNNAATHSVLVASTGIIGQPLPIARIQTALPQLTQTSRRQNAHRFAQSIMTTDTCPKECALRVSIGKKTFAIGACAKGSGMIHPNMATMLGFISTDARIQPPLLQRLLKGTVDRTFNNLTIDGDTSTNDMVLCMANGTSGFELTAPMHARIFEAALFEVCNRLCAGIAADGEGATRRIEIRVMGARSYAQARTVARTVADSNLVKTAVFGRDPNWGRILCAIGYSGASFSRRSLEVALCGIPVCRGTTPCPFSLTTMRRAMNKKIVYIDIHLHAGHACAVAHTCDLTYEYIRINAEYHT